MPDKKLKILHLEDLASDADLVKRALVKGGLDFDRLLTDNKYGFLEALENFRPDIILSDHSLPSFNSLEALKIVKEKGVRVPFILITATISEEYAVEVMKQGAWDYILKDRLQRLPVAIVNALDKHRKDTERERMIDRIIANEALYKDAERIAQFGTWRADLRTGETILSDAAYRVMGYEPGDFVPSDNVFQEILHPDDLGQLQKLIAENIRDTETTSMQFRTKGKDGQIRFIHSTFQIERDENGQAMSIVGFNQDITSQKQAELKIIESEAKYRHLFENNPLPMWVAEVASFEIVAVNEAAVRHYGYTREEFLSMNVLDLRPESELERFRNLNRAVPFTNPDIGSWVHRKKDGSLIHVQIFAHNIDYEGRPSRLILSNDITEVRLAQEELKKSLSQLSDYKAAMDQSSIVAVTDQHGIINYANDNFCRVSKYSREELIGQDHRIVNSGYHPKAYIKNMWDTISSGRIWKGELRNRAKDGAIYWVDTTILPFLDDAGKPYQYMSIRTDITERKTAESQIIALTQDLEKKVAERTVQLEQSIKELESFSYSVSHDLRAPLRVINGYSNLLMQEYAEKLSPDAIDCIRTVSDNAMQMGQLIEDLLNLSKLGLEAMDKSDVDMKTLVEMIIYEQKMNNDKVPSKIQIDELPPAQCSKNLIRQVWVNLIANAIKYSAKKQEPNIQVSSYITEGEIVYFVKDNGAGFDMKYANRLFGVFQRLHDKKDFDGTGVGLALVHRIITRHGGRVWAEAKPDEGATFYFSLPLIKEAN